MSTKVKVIIGIVITVLLVSGIWVFILFQRTKSVTEKFEGEIAQLTATLDALGPNVTCYTVTEDFSNHYDNNTAGQILSETALQPIEVPSSLVGNAYITSTTDIVGKYCKVNIEPGTPITYDLLMGELYDDTLRDVDITVNSWVVGMREGDYVDIRFTLPFGEDYIVLSHQRVQGIADRTIKMYLTEEEQHIYQSALVDYYLNADNGARIYLTKYVEPGVQQEAQAYYAPRAEVETMMRTDPNIVNKAQIQALSTFRPAIDSTLNQFITERDTVLEQAQTIGNQRNTLSSDVQSDFRTDYQQYENDMCDAEDTYEEEDVAINFDEAPVEDEETTEEEELEVEETAEAETAEAETVEESTEAATEEAETEAPVDDGQPEEIEVQDDTNVVG